MLKTMKTKWDLWNRVCTRLSGGEQSPTAELAVHKCPLPVAKVVVGTRHAAETIKDGQGTIILRFVRLFCWGFFIH